MSTGIDTTAVGGAPVSTGSRRLRRLVPHGSWLGLLPFLVIVGFGFVAPIVFVVFQAFRNSTVTQPKGPDGQPLRDPVTQQFITEKHSFYTWDNVKQSFHGVYHTALLNSIELSALTAAIATVLGLVLAYVVVTSGSRVIREVVSTISSVAANFGGAPLAFLFIAALDANSGVVTVFLQDKLHISLRDDLRFNLQGMSGMTLVYLYFLVPLMVLVMMPALEGLRPQWAEAAQNLGASRLQYWRHVAGPVLLPSVLGALLLLFCSSFSAFATAYALNHTFPLLPSEINIVINGNVLVGGAPLGSALAFDIIIFVLPLTVLYQVLQRRTSRWLS